MPDAHHITAIAQPELVSGALLRFLDQEPAAKPKARRVRKVARAASPVAA